jgi:hypothetical protein
MTSTNERTSPSAAKTDTTAPEFHVPLTPAGRAASPTSPVPPISQRKSLSTAKTDPTALALLGVMLLALAAGGSATLSGSGAAALQEIAQAIGIGRGSAAEAEQGRQLATVAELERTVHALSGEVAAMATRLKLLEHPDSGVADRFSLIEADIGALTAELRSLRTTRQAEPAATQVWVADQLNTAVSATQTDMASLRRSLDEHERTIRQEIDGVANRVDRLEQLVSRDLTASVRPVAATRKKTVRRKARIIRSARSGMDAQATMFSVPNGAWTPSYPNPAHAP